MTIIAFQGRRAAYSDMACRAYDPSAETLPCETFADAIEAVRSGQADLGMLACENSKAGFRSSPSISSGSNIACSPCPAPKSNRSNASIPTPLRWGRCAGWCRSWG